MKYVIKNCPVYFGYFNDGKSCYGRRGDAECKDIPDCLLKRIVALCKKEPQNIMLISNGCAYGTEENKAFCLAQDILKHLEIEEAE